MRKIACALMLVSQLTAVSASAATEISSVYKEQNLQFVYTDDVKVDGSIYKNDGGRMYVDGDLVVNGSVYKNSMIIEVTGDLIVFGDLYKNDHLYIGGKVTVMGEQYGNSF
ncbi:hypothetical protein [Pseudobacteriovorax antillogorgiicola]|uniref:Polymer-forming protein n=1 Tax=Pseudobacteriovorax antillogorgiicola TaxID=1513793 RepID=A0A1Y6CL37_9BACT|nr:hypothetical protein [Pseudobacteriovorax antillogorgiicola]TCS45921.1 hypothetical protein EDD56_12684 [Pseudobacteriovorax antillogorgiicola]SMF71042.1 hypothetical protein SAMN06296036_12614 [Pseudobacteriovorax antillogorgiicola]